MSTHRTPNPLDRITDAYLRLRCLQDLLCHVGTTSAEQGMTLNAEAASGLYYLLEDVLDELTRASELLRAKAA